MSVIAVGRLPTVWTTDFRQGSDLSLYFRPNYYCNFEQLIFVKHIIFYTIHIYQKAQLSSGYFYSNQIKMTLALIIIFLA